MEADHGETKPALLQDMADLLIEAKKLAEAQNDEQLRLLIRDALFRTGRLLADYIGSRQDKDRHH